MPEVFPGQNYLFKNLKCSRHEKMIPHANLVMYQIFRAFIEDVECN